MPAYTRTTWAQALLQALGIPPTSENVRAIVAWEIAEGGNWNNTAKYNPLNTTEAMPGDAGTMNSVGVRVYSSWSQGIAATVKTLSGYPGILSALRAGSSAKAVAQAVGASPWGTAANTILSALGYGTDSSAPSSDGPGSPTVTTVASTQNASAPGGALNPLNWFGDIANAIVQDVSKVAITALFVLGGVALVTVGLLRMVKPAVNKVANVAGRVAEAAA